MNQNKYKTFKEFYPYYLSEHKKPITKIFHAIGSLLSLFFFNIIFKNKLLFITNSSINWLWICVDFSFDI